MIPGVVQTPVNAGAGLTFGVAIRSILRSDPDVVLVGEIRDRETLNLCCQLSLTGHLVLTTQHTNCAAGVPRRMIDMGLPPFLAGDTLRLVSSQRLVRRLCPECSVKARLDESRIERTHELLEGSGLAWRELANEFRRPVGCPKCGGQGFWGRTLICEMLEVNDEVRRAIRQDLPTEEIERVAVREGMTTMAADGLRRAALGETTLDEVIRVLAVG